MCTVFALSITELQTQLWDPIFTGVLRNLNSCTKSFKYEIDLLDCS